LLKCLECDKIIELPDDPLVGEILSCSDCGASFELFKDDKGNFALRPAQIEAEDWGE
jgi:alpha-aminoadipate carrier protein LysW